MSGDVVAIVFEPDVAHVFRSSKRVNELLRSLMFATPAREGKGRRRAGKQGSKSPSFDRFARASRFRRS